MSETASEKLCSASAMSASEAGDHAADDLSDSQAHVDSDGGEHAPVPRVRIDVVMVAVAHVSGSRDRSY